MSAAATPAVRTQVQAALALRAAGRLEEALDALSTPGEYSSDFYTIRGEIQLALGRFQEAAGSYFTVVASDPENAFAQFNLAVCLQQLQRWDEAAQAFQKALHADAHRDDARLGLGACLLHLNRSEEALANFDACWSDAARTRALFGQAVALQLLHHYDEAAAAYRRLLEAGAKSEEVLSNLLALSVETQDWDAVQRCATQLLEVSPNSLQAHQGLAAVALERGEFEAAVQHCGRIVEYTPECVEAWHNLRFATGRVMSALPGPAASHSPGSGRK
ncbi:MAG TPA: tetratricopeptide repeat protein [Bryobacteraceae bacterium]|nr:tetratricopeptide repeat protein [Bryobacteraceae bacterium]